MSGLTGVLGEFGIAAGLAGGAIAALGLAGAGIAVFAAKSANEFHEMSEKTGVSVEALSSLSFAAKQSGVSTESLAGGLEKMTRFTPIVCSSGLRFSFQPSLMEGSGAPLNVSASTCGLSKATLLTVAPQIK
jgi:hypothetical protein